MVSFRRPWLSRLVVVVFLPVIAALAGCSTGYVPAGYQGGYSDAALGGGMHRIAFSGNAYTSSAYVNDMALLRAAEVAAREGYSYFTIVQSSDGSRVYGVPDGPYGSGGTTIISKPRSQMIIKTSNTNSDASFEARSVISQTRARYGM
ncbi:hypothetical protein JQR85_13495 [Stutzerimonas urumqiensis]|uniref:CC0125/CC1285 family lipoprotein n=1 Tax=Stutzerimonas urumqiensis TaxID=638269 RepID=UPI003DA20454